MFSDSVNRKTAINNSGETIIIIRKKNGEFATYKGRADSTSQEIGKEPNSEKDVITNVSWKAGEYNFYILPSETKEAIVSKIRNQA